MSPVMVNQDEEHLRLLSIVHYVMGGMMGFFACFGLIYVVLGVMFLFMPTQAFGPGPGQPPPPAAMGAIFLVLGSVITVLGWSFAALVIYAGRCIAKRKSWVFCLVMACIQCLWVPFGTVLGVFTIIALMRSTVQALFGRAGTKP